MTGPASSWFNPFTWIAWLGVFPLTRQQVLILEFRLCLAVRAQSGKSASITTRATAVDYYQVAPDSEKCMNQCRPITYYNLSWNKHKLWYSPIHVHVHLMIYLLNSWIGTSTTFDSPCSQSMQSGGNEGYFLVHGLLPPVMQHAGRCEGFEFECAEPICQSRAEPGQITEIGDWHRSTLISERAEQDMPTLFSLQASW